MTSLDQKNNLIIEVNYFIMGLSGLRLHSIETNALRSELRHLVGLYV